MSAFVRGRRPRTHPAPRDRPFPAGCSLTCRLDVLFSVLVRLVPVDRHVPTPFGTHQPHGGRRSYFAILDRWPRPIHPDADRSGRVYFWRGLSITPTVPKLTLSPPVRVVFGAGPLHASTKTRAEALLSAPTEAADHVRHLRSVASPIHPDA
jgi:hypothetical protein